MLRLLNVQNLALMEKLDLELAPGFTAVTGETGAGKSILLGALRMLAGERLERSVIRVGTAECTVEGSFYFENTEAIDTLLESVGLPRCEEGNLTLRRTLPRDPKHPPRITVNGALSTLANLRLLGEYWIDFHGPGEPQKLFKERFQLEMLDRYAGVADKLEAYQQRYRRRQALLAEREALVGGERLSEDEQAFYRNQLAKMDELNLSKDSITALEQDFTQLEHGQEIGALTATAVMGLVEGETAVSSHLRNLVQPARRLSELDPEATILAERLEALVVEVEDLASAYSARQPNGEWEGSDPSRPSPETVRRHMDLWFDLKRQYGDTLEAVRQKKEELAAKLAGQSDVKGLLAQLDETIAGLESELSERAAVLQRKRRTASTKLATHCNRLIATLGFKKAQIRVDLIAETQLTEQGDCRCAFQFAPNGGEGFRPLNKIASSGEAARVLLALKAILAEVDQTPLLVFDEVDANVGGEVGGIVGAELAKLAHQHQILCVTHLPQAAAQANAHYAVIKTHTANDETSVSIEALHPHPQKRIEELARMLGDRHSESAKAHATALLEKGSLK